jgi:hypothetical protein
MATGPMTTPPATTEPEGVVLTDAQKRQRRARSVALAIALTGMVVLFYVVTVVKLGPQVLNRPL